MPRPGADQVGGFFEFPPELLPALCGTITATIPSGEKTASLTLLDLCAGEGAAIHALATHVWRLTGARCSVTAAELEESRAATAKALIESGGSCWGNVHHEDAFRLRPRDGGGTYQPGAHLALLNPPYGIDRVHGRMEERWSQRIKDLLIPGGVLLFVLPIDALPGCAATLGRYYDDLSCYRFPDPQYGHFRQVVVVGRRMEDAVALQRPLEPVPDVLAWAADPTALAVLGSDDVRPRALPVDQRGGLSLEAKGLDAERLRALIRPSTTGTDDNRFPIPGTGLDRGMDSLLGRPITVALPPPPAYVALAIATGAFDGHRLEPDDPNDPFPPIYARSVFTRGYRTIKENVDKEGNVTGEVQVQRPELRVNVLDLHDYTYTELKQDNRVTGATCLADASIADLFARYRNALVALMGRQFPALHDPANPTHRLELGDLTDGLWDIQVAAVKAGLKQLARSESPWCMGDTGTGKTRVALKLAQAFAPDRYAGTLAALREAGFGRPSVRKVRGILALCPTNVVPEWLAQGPEILPGIRCIDVRHLSSLDPDAPETVPGGAGPGAGMTLYVLSKEDAKLGPSVHGAAWEIGGHLRCPRCGAMLKDTTTTMGNRRAHCTHGRRQPVNAIARIVAALAGELADVIPEHRAVKMFVTGRILQMVRSRWEERYADLEATAIREHRRSDAEADVYHARKERWAARAHLGLASVLRASAGEMLRSLHTRADWEYSYALRGLVLHVATAVDDEVRPSLLTAVGRFLYEGSLIERPEGSSADDILRVRRLGILLLMLSGVRDEAYEQAHRADDTKGWDDLATAYRRLDETGRVMRDHHTYAGGIDMSMHLGDLEQVSRASDGALVYGSQRLGGHAEIAAVFDTIVGFATWTDAEICGEALWGYEPSRVVRNSAGQPTGRLVSPRWPIAKYLIYLARRGRCPIDIQIHDEDQDFGNSGTAQEKAAHRLSELPGVPTIPASGSEGNGYVDSLFPTMWAHSRDFREEFNRDEMAMCVDRYGYRKRLVARADPRHDGRVVTGYGSASDREDVREDAATRELGKAPGLMPNFILRYIMPRALLMHKRDLGGHIPPRRDIPVAIPWGESEQDRIVAGAYGQLLSKTMEAVKGDAFSDRSGALLGAIGQLPRYVELCTADTGNSGPGNARRYAVRYSARYGGDLVVEAPVIPASYLNPKERWMLDLVRDELAETDDNGGRNVIIFLRNTGEESGLPRRIARLLKTHLGVEAAYLNRSKVLPRDRRAWITEALVQPGVRVLICNPITVKCGLNNLTYFNSAIWYQPPVSAIDWEQANGRIDRPGQTRPTRVYLPYLDEPLQNTEREILGLKDGAIQQAHGAGLESALLAVGVGNGDGEDDSMLSAAQLTLSLGEIICERYSALRGNVEAPAAATAATTASHAVDALAFASAIDPADHLTRAASTGIEDVDFLDHSTDSTTFVESVETPGACEPALNPDQAIALEDEVPPVIVIGVEDASGPRTGEFLDLALFANEPRSPKVMEGQISFSTC